MVYLQVKTTPKVKSLIYSFRIPILDREFRTTHQLYKKPTEWATGISSRCLDGKHCLFLDMENLREEQIEDEIKFLQEFYGLGNAYIYKNDNFGSWHITFLDKFPLIEAFKILSETNTDFAHLQSIKLVKGRDWCIRVTKKGFRKPPQFFKVIEHETEHEISSAHKYVMENRSKLLAKLNPKQYYDPKIYDAPILKYGKEDGLKIIPIIDYTTSNNTGQTENVEGE